MSTVGLITIAYNQPEGLTKLIDSAMKTAPSYIKVVPIIFMHSRLPLVVDAIQAIEERYPESIILRHGVNRGVARSWNDGIVICQRSGFDVTMLANDDVWFNEGDIEKLATMSQVVTYDVYCVMTTGFNHSLQQAVAHGMSCCTIQRSAIEVVGFYDENFFPAYNEDTDYALRVKRAGLIPFVIPDGNVQHIGSAAITKSQRLKDQNYNTHMANDRYWTVKWGCDKDHHTWDQAHRHPFNDAAMHPFFIGEEERHSPYPGHNRGDFDLVKF